jgi:hypothetical protein
MAEPIEKSRLVEVLLSAGVAIVAYVVAHRSLVAHFRVAPAIEDLFATCTGRLGWMPDPSALYALPQWTAFLERKIEYFPCDAIKGFRLFEIGASWHLQKYFHVALYEWFRFVGPTIEGFLSFQSAEYAITSLLAYLIFRLGLRRIVALACSAGFVWSSSHLGIVGLPIEYSKAPWALAAVWLCGVIVVRDTAGKSLGWAALGLGVVVGVGIGFKADLVAMVPLAVLTPLLFVRAAPGRGPRRKLTAALLVVAGITVGGGEMLYRNFFTSTGSLFPIQVIGGQDWQTESLHASSPLYDYGVTWDDTYVVWMINSYGERVFGKTAFLRFFTREMQEVATRMLVDLWTTFPGDLVLRVIAATIRVLWLNGLSPYLAVVGVFVVFSGNQRHGWFVVFVTAYLSACVSLVFQRRHIFHLEFISWWLAGVVVQAVLHGAVQLFEAFCDRDWSRPFIEARAQLLKPVLGAASCLLLIGAVTWAVLAAARQYQQAGLVRLVEHYQQMPRQNRGRTAIPAGTGQVSLRIDDLSLPEGDGSPEEAVSDYLVLTFRCRDSRPIRVRSKYQPPVVDSSNWNRDFSVVCADGGGESTLMLPIYQSRAGYRFDGLVMSQADAGDILSVATMHEDPSIRIWPTLLLPNDWRTRRWFETMKSPLAMPI